MPLAPNPFLQATAAAKSKVDLASSQPTPAAQPKDNASSFAQVYQDTQNKPAKDADAPVKSSRENSATVPAKKDAVANRKDDAAKPAVADSGNSLPASKADDKTASSDTTQAGSGDQASTDDSSQDASSATPVADAAPVDPTVDPALIQAAATPPTPAPEAQVAAPQPQPAVEAPLAAAATAAPVQAATTPNTDGDFDPAADPLDNLPAVRLAMEQSGHVSTASQSTTSKTTGNTEQDPNLTQNLASSVSMLVDQKTDAGTPGEGGEKSFKGLIEEGLKDLKSASSDTRVDDFANRLAALTQAAVPKTANALPVNQPLAMHQSGWTEEVVNRVMYLSSANLKSADIQLEPAELGRLDIKVNMSADQTTQINFISGHAGVRDALEGNMFRLRDLLQQQGLGQADVSVSDQSRGWSGQGQDAQQQQQQAQKGSNSGGARVDGGDDDLSVAAVGEAAAAAANTSVVVGSSAVDYYA
ncbi:flagellar hook-length control protein FliK [Pseudomonas vanderleydeniana]|uniref:Flagellar hook-length control protein FliK n=1 Tax=Pseudomonas vanderleydeniana TaxID=2745495 RepID=A0A9E6TU16_9PSED|nr:flagellar hook-length control protein FliK [Pseudomonas vanderleydeniana]QXI30101.1 flagellar hook-length control protein FliK [Pseudomonas vanderleydeniana]